MRNNAPRNLRKKWIKISTSECIHPKGWKNVLHLKKECRLVFKISKMYCFLKSKCYKSKNDILHTFIVYKIPAKEHEVVDR